jgi:predicted dehydrogenase
VSEDVDLVFIADCNGDGTDHRRLATPGIERRVPTFIDKPLANNYTEAAAIIELANHYNTPLLSLSILQTNPATARLASRISEVGTPDFAMITCDSMDLAALIHAVSIAHHLFGTGIQSVECFQSRGPLMLHLDYGGVPNRPSRGVQIHCQVSKFRFTGMYVSVFGPEGAIQAQAMNDFNASDGSAIILELIKEMVVTGHVDSRREEMLLALAVTDAAQAAQRSGKIEAVVAA